jgi:hypothetical protein
MAKFIKSYGLILKSHHTVSNFSDDYDLIAVVLPRLSYTRDMQLAHIRGKRAAKFTQSVPTRQLKKPTEDEETRFWRLCRHWVLEPLEGYSYKDLDKRLEEEVEGEGEEEGEEGTQVEEFGLWWRVEKRKGSAKKKRLVKPEWMLSYMGGCDGESTGREIDGMGPLVSLFDLLGGRGGMGTMGMGLRALLL